MRASSFTTPAAAGAQNNLQACRRAMWSSTGHGTPGTHTEVQHAGLARTSKQHKKSHQQMFWKDGKCIFISTVQ